MSESKQFFIVCRHHDETQWDDSVFNCHGGFETRNEAETLMRKVAEIPANEDFAFRVIKRV